jgi:hypothetical protein
MEPMNLQRWTQLSEIAASFGVIITLVILIQEVRTNTLAIRQQTLEQRAAAVAEPFLNPEVLPGLYARVKAVDGEVDPDVAAFMERYAMTAEEALQWTRHLQVLWRSVEAEFLVNGPTPFVESFVDGALARTDSGQAWGDLGLAWQAWESWSNYFDPAFAAYVRDRSPR